MSPDDALTALWVRFKETEDLGAREKLILHYSPLVKYVAGRVGIRASPTVENADLASHGLFGLIDAIQKFDLERKLKFETHAPSRIWGAIIDELRGLDWAPRPSARGAGRSNVPTLHWKANCSAYPATLRSPSDSGIDVEPLREVFAAVSFTHAAALDELLHAEEGCDPGDTVVDHRGGARRGPGRLGDQEHLGDRRRPVVGAGEDRRCPLLLRRLHLGRDRSGAGRVREPGRQLHTKAMPQLKSRMAEVD